MSFPCPNGCLQQIAANRFSTPQDVIAILLQGFVLHSCFAFEHASPIRGGRELSKTTLSASLFSSAMRRTSPDMSDSTTARRRIDSAHSLARSRCTTFHDSPCCVAEPRGGTTSRDDRA
jgi:hypothetical protein